MPKVRAEELQSKYALSSTQTWLVIKCFSVDQEKLHRQLIELEGYCKSCKNQPFKPELGEACCARSSGEAVIYSYISFPSIKHNFHFCFRKGKNANFRVLTLNSVTKGSLAAFLGQRNHLIVQGKKNNE